MRERETTLLKNLETLRKVSKTCKRKCKENEEKKRINYAFNKIMTRNDLIIYFLM